MAYQQANQGPQKPLHSVINIAGRTSFHFENFIYTWVIEKYTDCHNETNSLDIVSPRIVINRFNDKCIFQLSMTPCGHDPNVISGTQTFINLKVLSCSSEETKIRVKRCLVRNNGTDYNPQEEVFNIKKNAVLKYYITPGNISAYCLKDGNVTVKCTFTFRRSVSRDKPEYPESDAGKSIFEEYEELFYSGKFSDLTLIVGDKKFPVHKNILATRSPVFSAMLEHEMKESKENKVNITDVEPEIMTEVLLFIYANRVKCIKNMTAGLFAAADKYQLETLRRMCENVFLDKLNIDNLAEILKIVDKYDTCPRLYAAVLQFLSFNGNEVASWENFDSVMQTLSPTLMLEVTKATMLKS